MNVVVLHKIPCLHECVMRIVGREFNKVTAISVEAANERLEFWNMFNNYNDSERIPGSLQCFHQSPSKNNLIEKIKNILQ